MTTQPITLLSDIKSTNVRSKKNRRHPIQVLFGWLSAIAPGLAAGLAIQLFFRTSRKPSRAGERDVLADATELRVGDKVAWSWGDGPTVLLVHGWNGRGSQLGGFVEPLVHLGYRVVSFDALGHGASPGATSSIPALAADVRDVADVFGPVYGVIAHSMGGAATTIAFSEGLEVDRAVFIAPPADPRAMVAIFANAIGLNPAAMQRLVRRVERAVGRTSDEMDASLLAPSMRAPLFVIHDGDDKEISWRFGRSIADAWPDGAFMMTRGLGHKRILDATHVQDAAVAFIDGSEWPVAIAA